MTDLKMIVSIFIIAIVGIILADAIADTIFDVTNAIDITNETLTANVTGFVNATDVNTSMIFNLTQNNWVTDSVVIQNATGSPFTVTTDFLVNYTSEGITFQNNTDVFENFVVSNDTGINYSYTSTNYVNDSPSRILVNLIVLFFIIGLLLFVVDKVMIGMRGTGIFER